jgi:hypothetical protein
MINVNFKQYVALQDLITLLILLRVTSVASLANAYFNTDLSEYTNV